MPDYHTQPDRDTDDDPRLAIRRHTDRCFHRVEEVVDEGYIVDGVLIDRDDVAEARPLDEDGVPDCRG